MKRLGEYERLSDYYDDLWAVGVEQFYPLISNLLLGLGMQGCRVLDLGCGTGLLAQKLSGDGHWVDGVDISGQMLLKARERNLKRTRFFQADMRKLHLKSEYNLVTCTFDSINYLESREQLENFFLMISSALVPGGFFLFDSKTEHLFMRQRDQKILRDIRGYRFIQEKKYDIKMKKASILFRFPDGNWETHTQYPYSLFDLLEPIRQAGLFVYHSFGGYKGEIYNKESEKLVCISRSAPRI